jgi:hypothetical protein
MNTQITYTRINHLGQDGTPSITAKPDIEIIPGELQFKDIKKYLLNGCLFKPGCVNLPTHSDFTGSTTERDMELHLITKTSFTPTQEKPTQPHITADALQKRFKTAASRNWTPNPAIPEKPGILDKTLTNIKNKSSQLAAKIHPTPFQRLLRDIKQALISTRAAGSIEGLREDLKPHICITPKTFEYAFGGEYPDRNAGKIGLAQTTARRITDMLHYQNRLLGQASTKTSIFFMGKDGKKHTLIITPAMLHRAKETLKDIEKLYETVFDPKYGYKPARDSKYRSFETKFEKTQEKEPELTPEENATPALGYHYF